MPTPENYFIGHKRATVNFIRVSSALSGEDVTYTRHFVTVRTVTVSAHSSIIFSSWSPRQLLGALIEALRIFPIFSPSAPEGKKKRTEKLLSPLIILTTRESYHVHVGDNQGKRS